MRKNWIGCKIHMILIRQFFFSRLPSLTLAPMQVSVGAFLFKKIFSLFLFFTDVGVRNINVRVQEILLISYSDSILLTEGDRGLRKSF